MNTKLNIYSRKRMKDYLCLLLSQAATGTSKNVINSLNIINYYNSHYFYIIINNNIIIYKTDILNNRMYSDKTKNGVSELVSRRGTEKQSELPLNRRQSGRQITNSKLVERAEYF